MNLSELRDELLNIFQTADYAAVEERLNGTRGGECSHVWHCYVTMLPPIPGPSVILFQEYADSPELLLEKAKAAAPSRSSVFVGGCV